MPESRVIAAAFCNIPFRKRAICALISRYIRMCDENVYFVFVGDYRTFERIFLIFFRCICKTVYVYADIVKGNPFYIFVFENIDVVGEFGFQIRSLRCCRVVISRSYHKAAGGIFLKLRNYQIHRFLCHKIAVEKISRDYDYIRFAHFRVHHYRCERSAQLVSSHLRLFGVEKRERGIEMYIRYVKYSGHYFSSFLKQSRLFHIFVEITLSIYDYRREARIQPFRFQRGNRELFRPLLFFPQNGREDRAYRERRKEP